MSNNVKNTIPISKVTRAAAIDLGEDFLRVDATFAHWAVRGLNKISREVLRGGLKRVILPVHKNFKTISIPADFKSLAFIGVVDDCGMKHGLTPKGYIAENIKPEDCQDSCSSCGQDLDICEDMNVKETIEYVTFPETGDQQFEKKTSKYFESGKYFEKIIYPVWDMSEEDVVFKTSNKIITEFDTLQCGCLAKSDENISKIKEHCYGTYCKCYTPCRETSDDIGGYRIFEDTGIIQLDKNIQFDQVYIEYFGSLPKINGEFHVPEVAFETLVAFVKYKNCEHKKSMALVERDWMKRNYKTEKDNMFIILGRIRLSDIISSVRRTPKFELNGNAYSCDSTFATATSGVSSSPVVIIKNENTAVINNAGVNGIDVTMSSTGPSYSDYRFAGKTIVSVAREGMVLNNETLSLSGTTLSFNNGDQFVTGLWYHFILS